MWGPWGAKPPTYKGVKPPSLGSVCLYILILPTQNPVIFNNFFLEKYTVELRALHCLCLNLTSKTGNNVWLAIGETQFEPTTLQYGVPQGSVLGPVLFTVYTGTLTFLLEAHGVSYHFFADDTQLYIRVQDTDEAKHRLSSFLSDLKIWMARRKLKLNDDKTEIISVANFGIMSFGDTQLVPCESAKNLGVLR